MTFNTGTGFTDILTDSGTAVIDPAKPNLNIVGGTNVTTSASANVITINATAGGNDPTATSLEFDDFLGDNNSKLGWELFGVWTINSTSTGVQTGHPGIWSIEYVAGANGTRGIQLGDTSGAIRQGPYYAGGGILTVTWVLRLRQLSDASNSYTIFAGLGDNSKNIPGSFGIGFQYNHAVNSGNYQLKSIASSTATTENTSTAASTDWVKLEVEINAAASSVAYRIDGATPTGSPITTNIPTGVRLNPTVVISKVQTAVAEFDIDLFVGKYELTTPR